MKIPFSIPDIAPDCAQAIKEALDSGWAAPAGPQIDEFEHEITKHTGTKYAIAVSSGTCAIQLGLRLLNVGPDDEVVCPSFTYVASANPILYQGAKAVFLDIDVATGHLCPAFLEDFLSKRARKNKLPKAVIVPHIYGSCAPIDLLKDICDKYETPILEDAAEALGVSYKRQPVGSFGALGAFSFNGNKILTTSSGGALVTDSELFAKEARKLISQARVPGPIFEHTELAYNFRISNLLAAMGCAQFKHLAQFINQRKAVYKKYQEAFSTIEGITFFPTTQGCQPNYWLNSILLDQSLGSAHDVIHELYSQGIEVRSLWKPLHLMSMFRDCERYGAQVDEQFFAQGLSLPTFGQITNDQIDEVAGSVKDLLTLCA